MLRTTAPISDMTPLIGLRVLDLSHVIAGPFATLDLAQLGAEVTKVDKPGGGKVMHASPPVHTSYSTMGQTASHAF